MWGVCSGLRLRKPLAAVGGTSSPSLTSASHHYLSNGQKGNDGLPVSPTETLYFFGGNNVTEWNSLFQHYESPPYVLPHSSRAYSFGIAGQTAFLFSPFSRDFQMKNLWRFLPPGPGTGVPFHWHGPGFAEVIYGKKVMFDPSDSPESVFSVAEGSSSVPTALVLLPT